MSQRGHSAIPFPYAALATLLIACRLGTDPITQEPAFTVTVTLPSGDSLRFPGTSATWTESIGVAASPRRLVLLLRATDAPSALGPPVDLTFYWHRVTVPLAVGTYALTDTSHAGVLFRARSRIGAWVPDSGTVTVAFADTVSIQAKFRVRLRPVYSASDSLPHLLVTGTFDARHSLFPPRPSPAVTLERSTLGPP